MQTAYKEDTVIFRPEEMRISYNNISGLFSLQT